jgi:hypothetical protein
MTLELDDMTEVRTLSAAVKQRMDALGERYGKDEVTEFLTLQQIAMRLEDMTREVTRC